MKNNGFDRDAALICSELGNVHRKPRGKSRNCIYMYIGIGIGEPLSYQ